MRVAHFIQRYPPAQGGSEAYFARLTRYLADQGDQVVVSTTAALELQAFWSPWGKCLRGGITHEEGAEVRRYALWRLPGRRFLLKPLSLIPHRLWQCLTLPCNPIAWRMWVDAGRGEPGVDLVHAAAFPYGWPLACGLRLARRLHVPFVLTPFLHLGDPEDPADPTRRAYTTPALLCLAQAADRIIVQTQLERQALIEHGLPAAKTVMQGMGVDPSECTGGQRDQVRDRWCVSPGEVVIGHLANQSMEKGTVDLLRAGEIAWAQGHRFRLVLAGPEMPNFRRFWTSYARKERVLRLGYLDEQAKRNFFAGLDAFALPSRSDSFGLVLLEAWANGLANVAYRAGGIAELLRDGQDGLLVRCGDVAGLAKALGTLAADAPLRHRLGWAGRERTEREFRWDDKLERVSAVYRELAGKGAPAAPDPR